MTSVSQLRTHAREIFSAGLKSADPVAAIKRHVQLDDGHLHVADRIYQLARIRHVYIVGCGKAAARMAFALEEILDGLIAGGIVVVKYGHGLSLSFVKVVEAGHPIPDQAGLNGARQIMELVGSAGADDLILFLISAVARRCYLCPWMGSR